LPITEEASESVEFETESEVESEWGGVDILRAPDYLDYDWMTSFERLVFRRLVF
jgi:hypothetical protein